MSGLENAELRAGDLVAVALPPGPRWLTIVREVWDAGAALLPVDPRLPAAERVRLFSSARPTIVRSAHGVERLPDGIPADEGEVLIVATSGTSGAAKLVGFDLSALEAAVHASALALDATPDDPWLCCLPLAHIGGLLVLLRGVVGGAPVLVHQGFDPRSIAAERAVSFISVVPTMLGRLLDSEVDLALFRAVLVGGGDLPAEVRTRAEAAGARVVQTYGMTESCGGVVYDGRPLPGVDVDLDAEAQVLLRGPMMMHGYRLDAEASQRALTQDGWLRTGDAGAFDEAGVLRVTGRLDERIRTGGESVWPHEVEARIRSHPKVAEVAVAGRPDPEWGERVVAFVVPADPASPPTLEELRDHVGADLARFKAPRELVLVDDLPRTGPGKVRRAALG